MASGSTCEGRAWQRECLLRPIGDCQRSLSKAVCAYLPPWCWTSLQNEGATGNETGKLVDCLLSGNNRDTMDPFASGCERKGQTTTL